MKESFAGVRAEKRQGVDPRKYTGSSLVRDSAHPPPPRYLMIVAWRAQRLGREPVDYRTVYAQTFVAPASPQD
jgi:hypothetical protein